MRYGGDCRCPNRDPRTKKQCVCVDTHQGPHRWWRVRSEERPTWPEGFGRIEWETGEPSVPIEGGDPRG